MDTSLNLFSQVIQNLGNLNTQIKAITNLPPNAASVQTTANTLMASDVGNLKTIQSKVLAFTAPHIATLDTAISDLNNGSTNKALTAIQGVNTDSKSLENDLLPLIKSVSDSKTQILGLSNQLNTVKQELNTQITGLKSQAQNAKNQEDYYNKRKYYFLALGPFGLIGLGIAIGMIKSWTNKANNLNAQVVAFEAKIASANQLLSSVTALISSFSKGITQISNIKNSVNVLTGDIENVINDLNNSNTHAALLFLTTAKHELETLHTDAS
ncbi:MAG: hypothetical protein BM564_13550 [Bacteroidetes bacterium MedPE-SWsnd-G2]|nr:MAG: hypothetical protein BM564_13550 [Bacteroidetes bacterium MedPE-SWsnd-G2]